MEYSKGILVVHAAAVSCGIFYLLDDLVLFAPAIGTIVGFAALLLMVVVLANRAQNMRRCGGSICMITMLKQFLSSGLLDF